MHTTTDYQAIKISVENALLEGNLVVPEDAKGIVIFSHGSGSGRFSPRNNFVAQMLQMNGYATLLLDLLTEKEDLVYENRFDIKLLKQRLIEATNWILKNPETMALPIGYFGASTGAASALMAAADLGLKIKAVVSRGGRPDLAMEALPKVSAPTLLVIGSLDHEVVMLNQQAYSKLRMPKKLRIIKDATHLFPEPGKLGEVANLAAEWFDKYLKD